MGSWFVVGNNVGLCPRTSTWYSDLVAALSIRQVKVVYIFSKASPLRVFNTFRVRYFDTIGGNYYNLEHSIAPSMNQDPIVSSSRARSDPLGACRSRFLLSEWGKVKLEQFELGALLESARPRLYLIIYISEFLPRKGSAGKIIILNKRA